MWERLCAVCRRVLTKRTGEEKVCPTCGWVWR
jgi:hypothetical protein